MRHLIFGFCGTLALAGCNLNIGVSATDTVNATASASDSEAGPSTGTDASTGGGAPTTSGSTTGTDPTLATSSTGPLTGTGEATTGATDPTTDPTRETTGIGETSVGTSGESSTGEPPVGDAAVHDDCAPNDAPLVEFRLELDAATCDATWSGDQLKVVVYDGAPLMPGTYMIDGLTASASLKPGLNPPITASEGSLTIDAWADDAVSGSYSLVFPNVGVVEGAFLGPHCPGGGLCG